MFQSPRSGKFESNQNENRRARGLPPRSWPRFQSPRSGKFESNPYTESGFKQKVVAEVFQSPRSGKFESNSLKNALRLTMSF